MNPGKMKFRLLRELIVAALLAASRLASGNVRNAVEKRLVQYVFACLVTVMYATGVNLAYGTVINNSTGLATPDIIVNFNNTTLIQDDEVTNQFAGVNFDPNTIFLILPEGSDYFLTNSVGNFQDKNGTATYADTRVPFFIHFSDTVTEAAFQMRANYSFWTITALLGTTFVEDTTVQFPDTVPDFYVGFTGILFDTLKFEVATPNHGSVVVICDANNVCVNHDFMVLDNIQLTADRVPEPGSGLLVALALASMMGFVRSVKRKQS